RQLPLLRARLRAVRTRGTWSPVPKRAVRSAQAIRRPGRSAAATKYGNPAKAGADRWRSPLNKQRVAPIPTETPALSGQRPGSWRAAAALHPVLAARATVLGVAPPPS